MRDLIQREAEFGRAMLAELTARPAKPPAEPVGGVSSGPATCVWAGGRKAPASPVQDPSRELEEALNDLALAVVIQTGALGTIYAAAARVMAEAGRMPIGGSEAWCETDEEYRRRLLPVYGKRGVLSSASGGLLDDAGARHGILRARLVPVRGG